MLTTIAPAAQPGPDHQAPGRTSSRSFARQLVIAVAAIVVGCFLAWFVWANRAAIDPRSWLGELQWGWVALALVASVASLVGNSINLMGVVPVRLRFGRTFAAQTAGTVARLVSPASVGSSAVNIVYLRRAGMRTPAALGSVSIAHAVQFVTTTVLLAVVMVWIGNAPSQLGLPSQTHAVLGIAAFALAVGVAGIVVWQVPPLRARVAEFFSGVHTSVTDVLVRPGRAALAFGGALMTPGALTVSLWASAHAFGAPVHLSSALLILLVGSAAGGLIPVPGGIGAIDACLIASLTATGIGLPVAVPTVALFRLMTLWLQLPAGLAAGAALRRRGWL